MSTQSASATASSRSTVAARAGMLFGLGAVVGLVMTASGSGLGFAVLLVSLGGLYVAVDQHFGLRDLATIGSVPVSSIALRPTVLPREIDPAALLPLVSALPSDEHCLVRTDDGFRLLTVAMVTDIALTTRSTVHLDMLGRKATTVSSGLAVDRLPRPPAAGETFVVVDVDGRNPAVLNRAAVAAAVTRLTADVTETANRASDVTAAA